MRDLFDFVVCAILCYEFYCLGHIRGEKKVIKEWTEWIEKLLRGKKENLIWEGGIDESK